MSQESPPTIVPGPPPADPVTLRLLAESLRASGTGRIHLRGESMLPTLRDGWKVHVRSSPAESLRVGDIGAFVNRGVLTIHRLIWRKVDGGHQWFIFQGDNSPMREMVGPEAILGRVVAAEGEWARNGVSTPIPVGNDERAFFYRNAYRIHHLLSSLLPAARLPEAGIQGGLPYRCLRTCFRILERLFVPRPRRPPSPAPGR